MENTEFIKSKETHQVLVLKQIQNPATKSIEASFKITFKDL